jgi:hypothetical protein
MINAGSAIAAANEMAVTISITTLLRSPGALGVGIVWVPGIDETGTFGARQFLLAQFNALVDIGIVFLEWVRKRWRVHGLFS